MLLGMSFQKNNNIKEMVIENDNSKHLKNRWMSESK